MKVTPIVPITALRNQKKRSKPSKEDFKNMVKNRPPDGIA